MREKVLCQHYLFRSGIFVETLLDQKFIHDDPVGKQMKILENQTKLFLKPNQGSQNIVTFQMFMQNLRLYSSIIILIHMEITILFSREAARLPQRCWTPPRSPIFKTRSVVCLHLVFIVGKVELS